MINLKTCPCKTKTWLLGFFVVLSSSLLGGWLTYKLGYEEAGHIEPQVLWVVTDASRSRETK